MLMPDFQGKTELIQQIIEARPAVLAHNLETVRGLTAKVRDARASYDQSLDVLHYLKLHCPEGFTKSSLMLGVGESREETLQAMEDLREVGVDFLTLGQYLQPSVKHYPLQRYVHPDEFKELKSIALAKGFLMVASSPLTRSSYHADEDFLKLKKLREKESQCHSLQ